jgi:DNA mismatch endonuclease Vsr
MQEKDLPGRPDFFFSRHALAVFVDGCFWHACPTCGHTPKTNSVFWTEKLSRNRERDRVTEQLLKSLGIRTLRIWEHEIIVSTDAAISRVLKEICSGSHPVPKHSRTC